LETYLEVAQEPLKLGQQGRTGMDIHCTPPFSQEDNLLVHASFFRLASSASVGFSRANEPVLTSPGKQALALAEGNRIDFQTKLVNQVLLLVEITERGRSKYEAAMQLREEWANRIASSTTLQELKTTVAVMRILRKRLQEEEG
jgi:hypothetical protein